LKKEGLLAEYSIKHDTFVQTHRGETSFDRNLPQTNKTSTQKLNNNFLSKTLQGKLSHIRGKKMYSRISRFLPDGVRLLFRNAFRIELGASFRPILARFFAAILPNILTPRPILPNSCHPRVRGGLSFLCVHISLSTAKHLSNPWKFANARARRFQFTSELEPFFFQRKRTERSVQIFIKGEASGTSGQERGKLLHIQILL